MPIEISFILPIYNVAPYLSNAIDSILRQNISKEIILVDDGSTDNSLNIALNYSKKYPFIYVIHSQNKEVSTARNAGLRIAQGEYVLFLDPDDTLDENVDLSYFYTIAKQNNIDIVKGLFNQIDLNGLEAFIYPPIDPEREEGFANILSLNQALGMTYLNSRFIIVSCLLIKRELLIKNHITFHEKLHYVEDYFFILNLMSLNGSFIELPILVMNYRKRESSKSTVISEKIIESLILVVNLLIEKMKNAQNIQLYNIFKLACATHIFELKTYIKDPAVSNKYHNCITQDMHNIISSLNDDGITVYIGNERIE